MAYANLNTTKTWDQITKEVRQELARWGITDYQLPFKGDSVRLGSVTLRVRVREEEKTITCNRFQTGNWPERNYSAIALAIRSARLADQRGILDVFAQAAQLAALPDPNDPRHILGVGPESSRDKITRAYRQHLIAAHPDQGGTAEALERIREAGRKLGVA